MKMAFHIISYPLLLSDFNETRIFSTDFREILKYQISRKIPSVGAEFFLADGRMDMTKQIVAFRNFSRASKTPGTKAVQKNKIFVVC